MMHINIKIIAAFIGLIVIGVVLYFMLKKSTNILNISANKKEFLQILPTSPDTSSDYQFLRPTTANSGFTISMWVKFPSVRDFKDAEGAAKTGQSECLVEIFKSNAWEEAGTNDGGYFYIVRRGSKYDNVLDNKISAGFIGKEIDSITAINDTEWHHIAVSVLLVNAFSNNYNSSQYEISLYIDGVKTTKTINITDKDQIFIGHEAHFNVGKYTRGMSSCYDCGFANMSFTKPQLDNRVLSDDDIKNLAANKPS
jgi:hypothetical protein